MTFRTITEEDLLELEIYVQTELMEELMLLEGFEPNPDSLAIFFGAHVEDPAKFTFNKDEKDLVIRLSAIVKQRVESKGIDHFYSPDPRYHNQEIPRFFMDTNQDSATTNNPEHETRTHKLLKKFSETADKNAIRSKEGYRFDDDIKDFAVYVRILSGVLAYQTLQNNLNLALPSLSATNRYIRKAAMNLTEGVPRFEELAKYLAERNLPMMVTLSEDATRIAGRVQYDSKVNEIIGFVLPTNNENGMPIPHAFPARNYDEIFKHFTDLNSVAHFVNVIMAQPLANFPAFCVLLFSSNGNYTADTVTKRLKFITGELAKVNVKVLAIATDSDPRYNSSMKKLSSLGGRSDVFSNTEWFNVGVGVELPFYIQDTIHLVLKLRNLILRTWLFAEKLPFGRFFIQVHHLELLLKHFSKDQHELTSSVLNPHDKQNFSSVERISNGKVIQLLEANFPDSAGTAMFLTMIGDIIESFRSSTLTPLERIHKIWRSVFLMRFWRKFILRRSEYTIKDNCVTTNTYTCLEINAHSLVLILLYLEGNQMPNLFLPGLIDSQACESFFRQIRSMSSTYSTVVNCTVKEIIGRINRIHLQNQVCMNPNFVFPRIKNSLQFSDKIIYDLPNKIQIFEQIEKSKHEATDLALRYGLIEESAIDGFSFAAKISVLKTRPRRRNTAVLGEKMVNSYSHLIRREAILLKNYAYKFAADEEVPDTSHYVEAYHDHRKRIVIQKPSLCWLLQREYAKLSSDRIQRVKDSTGPKKLKTASLRCSYKILKSKRNMKNKKYVKNKKY